MSCISRCPRSSGFRRVLLAEQFSPRFPETVRVSTGGAFDFIEPASHLAGLKRVAALVIQLQTLPLYISVFLFRLGCSFQVISRRAASLFAFWWRYTCGPCPPFPVCLFFESSPFFLLAYNNSHWRICFCSTLDPPSGFFVVQPAQVPL